MGFAGALAGTLGLMTPSLLLVTFAAAFFLYFRDSKPIRRLLSGVRPATIGLIAAAVIFFADSSIFRAPLNSLWTGSAEHFAVNWRELLIFAAVLFTQWKWKWNLVATLFGAGFISLMLYMI
jgi:chromate transporter